MSIDSWQRVGAELNGLEFLEVQRSRSPAFTRLGVSRTQHDLP